MKKTIVKYLSSGGWIKEIAKEHYKHNKDNVILEEYEVDVKDEKSELDIMKEKFDSEEYICLYYSKIKGKWTKMGSTDTIEDDDFEYKLIHKKHKDILNAYLKDNSVDIEYENSENEKIFYTKVDNFIAEYVESLNYRFKQQYPIFKRNEDGEVYKLEDGINVECVLSDNLIGYRWFENKLDFSLTETIPYDKERGLYNLQPVWCWNDEITDGLKDNQRTIRFYLGDDYVNNNVCIGKVLYDNIEPITPEQLKTMPFIFEMYKKLLNAK